MDQLFDCLEGFVTLLHSKQRLLPVFEEGLLGHDNPLDFDGCLLESVTSCSCFFLLGDELGLVQSLLLV
jgi:hypothetical protein